MPRALIIEFGACGVGCDKGPPRAYRLWVLQIAVERRGLVERLAQQNRVMRGCRRLLWLIARRASNARFVADITRAPAIMEIDAEFATELDGALHELEAASDADQDAGE